MKTIKIGSLFSGIGGFELGLEAAIPNAETIWQVEQEPFCLKVLQKHWPDARRYNDVKTVGRDNLEEVDIICGGFPCQDISIAGKGEGINGTKSGLWWEMLRIISELRPKVAVMENVPMLVVRGLSEVLGSLSEIGYDAEWQTVRASDYKAPHRRERVFIVAYRNEEFIADTNSKRCKKQRKPKPIQKEQSATKCSGEVAPNTTGREAERHSDTKGRKRRRPGKCYVEKPWEQWTNEPPLCRVDDGPAYWMDRRKRLKALGNAIVPQCAEFVGKQIVDSGLL